MRWSFLVLAATSWALVSCKTPVPSAPPPTDPPTFDEPGSGPAGEAVDPNGSGAATAEPEGCRAGGTAWDGKHEGCLYEVGGCCYETDAAACAAAGCDAGGCQILESAPAQVHCRAAP